MLILLLGFSNSPTLLFKTITEKTKVAEAAGENMILFWDQDWIPTGWTCISCNSGDDFYQKFPRGEATYGGTSGSVTSTHTASGAVTASITEAGNNTGAGLPVTAHTHVYTNHSCH